MNWEKLDKEHRYNFKSDRLKTAKKYGYSYISECTAMLYEKHQSTQTVATMLGISPTCVQTELKKIGAKIRPRGGNNHRGKKRIGRHHWNPLATNTRAPFSTGQ